MKILGEKMDALEEWGVLRKPEDLGIIPEYVVPSMLTPKPEKDQYRLVTDFASLNKYIRKLPTVSPNIQEAKAKIAKYKYHVFLDLSNIKICSHMYLSFIREQVSLNLWLGNKSVYVSMEESIVKKYLINQVHEVMDVSY